MFRVSEIFQKIQEIPGLSNQLVYQLTDEFLLNPRLFLETYQQCFLKILKYGSKCSKKNMDKYDKLTEKFFNYLQNNYISKNNIPEPFKSKKHIYEYL